MIETEQQLTPAQLEMVAIWEQHMRCEFETRNAKDTIRTMVEGAHVNHVPVLTGGVGLEEVKHFYETYFIPHR